MQPVEAFRRVIELAKNVDVDSEPLKTTEAVEICERLITHALPIARFQCMVTVEGIDKGSKLGLGDYTICSTTISGIKNGLIGLSMEPVSVYVRLWERFDDTAEMLSGYQGKTKCMAFRSWLADIDRFWVEREQKPQVPQIGA